MTALFNCSISLGHHHMLKEVQEGLTRRVVASGTA